MSDWYPRYFPEDYYHEDTGVYIPRLHGKPYYEWYRQYGCANMGEIIAKARELEETQGWDEARMDIIGQNGPVGYTAEDMGLSDDVDEDSGMCVQHHTSESDHKSS